MWGPPFTISDWLRPRYEPKVMCLLLKHRETQSRGYFIFFSRIRLVALVHPQIFFSRTLDKLGRTLEPCFGTMPGKDRTSHWPKYSFCASPTNRLIPMVLACDLHKNSLGPLDAATVGETKRSQSTNQTHS